MTCTAKGGGVSARLSFATLVFIPGDAKLAYGSKFYKKLACVHPLNRGGFNSSVVFLQ